MAESSIDAAVPLYFGPAGQRGAFRDVRAARHGGDKKTSRYYWGPCAAPTIAM